MVSKIPQEKRRNQPQKLNVNPKENKLSYPFQGGIFPRIFQLGSYNPRTRRRRWVKICVSSRLFSHTHFSSICLDKVGGTLQKWCLSQPTARRGRMVGNSNLLELAVSFYTLFKFTLKIKAGSCQLIASQMAFTPHGKMVDWCVCVFTF